MPATAAARRVSARAAPAARPARAVPPRAPRPVPARTRARTAARRSPWGPALVVALPVGAVSGLADSAFLVRLTRGRLWIGALTTLLVGIVAVNVAALSFSASASKDGKQAATLARENSALRARIANGLSNERVQKTADQLGLVLPEPGSIRYLHAGASDAAVAAHRLESGSLAAGAASAPTFAPVTTTAPASSTTAVVSAPGTTRTATGMATPPTGTTTPSSVAPPAPTANTATTSTSSTATARGTGGGVTPP